MKYIVMLSLALAACSTTPSVPDGSADARATCVFGAGVYGHGYVLMLGADRSTQDHSKGTATIKCGDSSASFTEGVK